MWNNLKVWQKSIIVLLVSFAAIYILGILFVPTHNDNLTEIMLPSLIYCLFLVLPILIIKYSQKKLLKVIAGIILGIFVLTVTIPLVAVTIDMGSSALISFKDLYRLPVMGWLVTLMVLSRGGGFR